jgi:hypothetical protein
MAKVVKPSGSAVWDVRRPRYHGSEPQRSRLVAGGKLHRAASKPGLGRGTGRPRGGRA